MIINAKVIFMKNVELRMIAYLLHTNPEKFKDGGDGVTLVVNGLLLSGITIPRATYIEQDQNLTFKSFFEVEKKVIDELAADVETDDVLNLESYTRLYLKNARYFVEKESLPTNGMNYAVVNIDSVDAFNLGVLAPDSIKAKN